MVKRTVRGKSFGSHVTAVVMAALFALAGCGSGGGIEQVDEGELRRCIESRGVDAESLPDDFTTLPPEQAQIIDSCLREQRSSWTELIAHRRDFAARADAYARAFHQCMRAKGWDLPEPTIDESGAPSPGDHHGHGAESSDHQQTEALDRDIAECSRMAHGSAVVESPKSMVASDPPSRLRSPIIEAAIIAS